MHVLRPCNASRRASSSRTGALRHTREFEAAGPTLDALVFRFVPEHPLPLYKAPKDVSEIPVGEYGPYAREARERAMRDNPPVLEGLRRALKADAGPAARDGGAEAPTKEH